MVAALLVVLLICFVLNVPIAFSMVLASIAAIFASGGMLPATIIPQYMVAGANSFVLLAIPFFMMAGALMEGGGVSKRIVRFAETLVGHQHGGLSAVSIVSCAIFAAISGSTPATAAAVGGLTIPEMEQRGYDKPYASATVASAACLGVIIPPSTTMVIYGVTANVSIGKLLIGGFAPGVFLMILLLIVNYCYAKKLGYPTGKRCSAREVWIAFKDAFFALLMPVIILGGIMTGVFTPTESACVAVVYGFFVGFFIYRELKLSDIVPMMYKAALNSAMIILLIAVANGFGYILTVNQVSAVVSNFLLGLTDNAIIMFFLIIVLYLILGTFMDTTAIIMLAVPMLAPVVQSLGVDPIHFGVVTVCALATGMATPPVGISLFATCSVAKISMGSLCTRILPFLFTLIAGLFILAVCEPLVTLVPNLLIG